MYSNSYGYGVYKRNQVNMGNPFQVKSVLPEKIDIEEDAADEVDNAQKKAKKMMDKAREEAQLIKREAELEAERLLEEAQQKAESHIEEIEQNAKENGYRYGESVAQQHYQDLLTEAQDFKNRSKNEYEETIKSLEQDIIELAVEIAKKVIGAEFSLNREVILNIAGETIRSCTNRDQILVKVSSEDYDYVVQNQEKIRNSVRDLGQLEIRGDKTLVPGSCVIDTGLGMVDGSVETKLELIEQAFLEVLGDKKTDE